METELKQLDSFWRGLTTSGRKIFLHDHTKLQDFQIEQIAKFPVSDFPRTLKDKILEAYIKSNKEIKA